MPSAFLHFLVRCRLRLGAAAAAALVLALSVFAASPAAHAWLHVGTDDACHHGPAPEDDAGCAVVLFAAGVTTPVQANVVAAPAVWREARSVVTEDRLRLVSPRYLRHPERGPPARV